MTQLTDGFDNDDREYSINDQDDDVFFYDPTDPELLKTRSGQEIPDPVPFTFIEGDKHPTMDDLAPFTRSPEAGSLCLPATIPLVNRDTSMPLSREAMYGVDLVLQSKQRSTHTMVFGVTGAGKNVSVLDNMRYSAIHDPTQNVVSFSLKASDYGPIAEMCKAAGKRLIVVNLDDANRSLGWNPLETADGDVAFDHIRRFADAMKNHKANETEFWNQWIKTAFMGAWQSGHKSFPAIYQFFYFLEKSRSNSYCVRTSLPPSNLRNISTEDLPMQILWSLRSSVPLLRS